MEIYETVKEKIGVGIPEKCRYILEAVFTQEFSA